MTTAPNAEQRARWNGPSGTAWTEYAEHFERGYADYDAAYLAAVDARAEDLVLDVGSGPGALALRIATTARRVVGVDVSAPLVDLARRRAQAAGRDNAIFVAADAQVDPPDEGPFDVVVSHFGSMFFDDSVAAFTSLCRALRPGGRLVLLTWQGPERNPWQVEVLRALHPDQEAPIPPTDGPSPFGLSDAARVRSVLGAAGFVDVELEDLRAPHWSGADPDDAVRFTVTHNAAVLDGYDEAARRRALDRLRALFEAHHTRDGVLFDSATWLVRARRP
ncbi:class I SAM-dependent methyltransferase [Actinomycetospora endophytica]|uniref:Class I SAM-dependent methyltransferase n=1 Tax=Actinomycetospora endophytica TaxID=2291215 RepID=A0ABS8PIU1_9PSEU|nr:class I SAM-dependent methyltransferase [Actinomycetospora endophytica]MCD2198196.1 class I SAM-dependent methyltransferase [Actinomycetospora endophytica]